jgi:hypothetical protein
MRYVKDTPRIVVKFINADTEQELFEIKDRSWMNIGEIFTNHIVTELAEQELKNRKITPPKKLMVLAVGEYELE